MIINTGLWISPEGDLFEVEKDHATDLYDFPLRFRLKPSQVKSGKLEDLIPLSEDLIRQGWIRARQRGFHGWIFQVRDVEEQLGNVAEILLKAEADPEERVNVAPLGIENPFFIGNVADVYSGEILKYPQR